MSITKAQWFNPVTWRKDALSADHLVSSMAIRSDEQLPFEEGDANLE
jgi:hypothetical protein